MTGRDDVGAGDNAAATLNKRSKVMRCSAISLVFTRVHIDIGVLPHWPRCRYASGVTLTQRGRECSTWEQWPVSIALRHRLEAPAHEAAQQFFIELSKQQVRFVLASFSHEEVGVGPGTPRLCSPCGNGGVGWCCVLGGHGGKPTAGAPAHRPPGFLMLPAGCARCGLFLLLPIVFPTTAGGGGAVGPAAAAVRPAACGRRRSTSMAAAARQELANR